MMYERKSGYSLTEMVIVLGIIAFLMYMMAPMLTKMQGKINGFKTKLSLAKVRDGVVQYMDDNPRGNPPSKPEGHLEALIRKPRNDVNSWWKGPYLGGMAEVPLDAWGRSFCYNAPPVIFKNLYEKFEVYSVGQSGEDTDARTITFHAGA